MTKLEKLMYQNQGIEVITIINEKGNKNDYIVAPNGKWFTPFLKPGNSKTGEKVFTFSLAATNQEYITLDGETVKGSCPCHCPGCYGEKGCYTFSNTLDSILQQTLLTYRYLAFVEKAIRAQLDYLKTTDVHEIRIHAIGDFFSRQYLETWKSIIKDYAGFVFWTYTKTEYVNEFDRFDNANIVRFVVPGFGYNFGHIAYVLQLYKYLVSIGEKPYICRCGVDKNQHCQGCAICASRKYVLFIEHSTEYKAGDDPLYSDLLDIIQYQDINPDYTLELVEKALNKTWLY